ncbi:MAG: class I SAM-dependent methyltransferase [Ardenticatenaceae bacterium]|nr:class I SAM-dependent methyltransferase [Ardenticatenaceae bacterium]
MNTSALPDKNLLEAQAAWLAPARGRLLRRVGVARRRRILDLGAGYGAATGELARRGGGVVVALDRAFTAVSQTPALNVNGDARHLPFQNETFDLVFCQCVLLWVREIQTAVTEIHRILQPGGVLIALEPDYAGLIEQPPQAATRDLWLAALARAGAEPEIGRKLPGILAAQGFDVRVDLLESVERPSPTRFDFLRTLPLTPDEQSALARAEEAAHRLTDAWAQIAHLPFFLITAVRP